MTKLKGQIYLIKMCDTIQNIFYKVGRSINFYKRQKNYNYIEILNVIKSDDIVYDETEIIKIFNNKCKINKGREFFTSESDDFVLKIFLDYFINKIVNPIVEPIVNPIVDAIIEPIVEPIVNSVVESINIIDKHIKKENNIITINKSCPSIDCRKEFIYFSELKKHLYSSCNCSKDIIDIELFILQKKTFLKKEEKKCIICNSVYSKKSSLDRHIKNSHCKVDIKELKTKLQIEYLKNEIENLKKHKSKHK